MSLPRIVGTFGVVMDPDIRFAESGKCILKLRLKANKRVKDHNGNSTDGPVPLFIDATAFGQMAERAADSIVKGDTVTVEGTLQQEEWADKETGEKRMKVSILIDEIGMSMRWNKVSTDRESVPAAAPSESNDSFEPPF